MGIQDAVSQKDEAKEQDPEIPSQAPSYEEE